MGIFDSLKPTFWDKKTGKGLGENLFNYRRMWQLAMLITSVVTLGPLLTMAVIDYRLSEEASESETMLRVTRLVSNTKRVVSAFLEEREAAVQFVTRDNSYEELADPARLGQVLGALKESFGGFVDLGVLDASGKQVAYVGPHALVGRDYSQQASFKEVLSKGRYVSDVFRGFRDDPHLVVTVRRDLPDGRFFVLRATLDTSRFMSLTTGLELAAHGEAFLINREGVLQTPSTLYGAVLTKVPFEVPQYQKYTTVIPGETVGAPDMLVGYAYIPDSPFILVISKSRSELMSAWYETRLDMVGFLVGSIWIMLLTILGVSTYLVSKIQEADRKRVAALHHIEHADKMASIGRLAAGVAHEINNPLAIINEKAGLIKDLFTYRQEYQSDPSLMKHMDSIIASVQRCGTITKRLLSFARHLDVSLQPVSVRKVLEEVLGFLHKEAEYRSIEVKLQGGENVPDVVSDRGQLQQIFLNLINNAFQAMNDGGHLAVAINPEPDGGLSVAVSDDGCGISETDQKRIFEPFYTTKASKGGTGLGLSITYSLVQELGGRVDLVSKVGHGTTFIVRLPAEAPPKQKGERDAGSARG
jgi:signal transduction histidine kinase